MKEKSVWGTVKSFSEKCVNTLSVILLLFIFGLGLAQVIWRWILNNPIVWSEEMIRLTYVWICYLGWVLAERADSHIRITAILNALPKEAQKWMQLFCHVLTIIFSVLMVIYGTQLISVGAKRTAVSFKMNFGIVYAMGPICNFLIILYEVAYIIECLKIGPRDYRDKGGDES